MITRRRVLQGVLLAAPTAGRMAGARNEFWNSKDPADWNEKEISELLTHSPWTRDALVESKDYQGPEVGMAGIENGGGARRGTGGDGSIGVGPGSMGPAPQLRVRVRWESALPVCAALKSPVPAEAARLYIISVAGLPLRQRNVSASQASENESRKIGIQEAFKEVTSLERKGKNSIRANVVELVEEPGLSYLRFGFLREPQPISAEDKEVVLATSFGRYVIKTKFTVKDMSYRGQLALDLSRVLCKRGW